MSLVAAEPAPRPGKFEKRKEMILLAATDVMARKGVRGMTLAEVAARLDLVPTAVSYYFRKKEDLAAACFLRAIERYDALAKAATDAAEDGPGRTRAFVRLFFEHLAARRAGGADPIVPFNDVRAIGDPAVNSAYVDMFRKVRSVAFGPAQGGLSRAERNARTHLLLSQMFWVPVWAPDYDAEDLPRAADRMADILLFGLAAPGAALTPEPLGAAGLPGANGETPSEAFLKVATQLINEEGYRGASVSKISSRLNVTKGSFYHHNAAKDDLVAACFDRTIEIMRQTQRAAEAAPRGLDRVVSATATLIRSELSGETPLLRTSALTSVPEGMYPDLIKRFDRIALRFASALSDGVADGSARPVDTHIAAQTITGAINAAAELRFWASGASAETVFDLYGRPMFEGLYAPSSQLAG